MSDSSSPAAPPPAGPSFASRHPQPRRVSPIQSLYWLQSGWKLFVRDAGVWVAISLIFFVMLLVLTAVPLLGWAIVPIGFPILVAGMLIGCDELSAGRRLRVEHLFAGLRVHAGNLAMVGVFYLAGGLVAGFAAALIGGGAALTGWLLGALETVGLGLVSGALLGVVVFSALWVVLITALWFAPALVVLRDTPPLDAMKLSLAACFANFGAFAVLGVLVYVLVMVALVPAGLGVLLLIPVLAGTVYASFQDVFGPQPALPAVDA